MSLDRGRIQRQRHGVLAQLRQGFEDDTPSAALGPTIEAVIDRRVRAVFPRTIAPARPALQHVDDAADDASIIPALRSSQAARKMRLKMLPLPIIQPEQVRAHFSPLRINSQTENHWTLIRYRP